MSAIIPGYEYDIFISYRQKDNKYDGWVTEFVDNLRKELEATFKDEVTIYYDINPHDGLLETHNVDASLKEKLKCLVFIPVISQTYCDPRSFAWQNEFIAFNRFVEKDKFGRDIKLSNGNVASRILPVKIHDLDRADKDLLEYELGGVFRGIEFIYKSAGVNRPLRASEDHPTDNSNKTYYRDQINKVANAVKEIINGLKFPDNNQKDPISNKLIAPETSNIKKSGSIRPQAIFLIIILGGLFLSAFIFLPELLRNSVKNSDKSLTVLPFENLSNDPDQDYFGIGISEEILNQLFKIGDLKLKTLQSSMRDKILNMPISEIASELGVTHVLQGSVQKQEEKIIITVKLIDKKNNLLWSNTYPGDLKERLSIQGEVAHDVAINLKVKGSPEVAKRIDRVSTTNPQAYDLFLRGLNKLNAYWDKSDIAQVDTAQDFFIRAIELDPDFSMAYAQLGASWWFQGHWSKQPSPFMYREAIRNLNKAIELDPQNGVAYANLGVVQHNWLWDKEAARRSLETARELMPKSEEVWIHNKVFFWITEDCDELEKLINSFETSFGRPDDHKVLLSLCQGKINEALNIDPNGGSINLMAGNLNRAKELSNPDRVKFDVLSYLVYGLALAQGGQIDSAKILIHKLEELGKIRYVNPSVIASLYKAIGDENMADLYIKKAFEVRDLMLHHITKYPPYHDLRNDPKVKDIVARSWIPLKE